MKFEMLHHQKSGTVKTEDNPADNASRGLTAEQLVRNAQWLNGPSFLRDPEFQFPTQQWTPPMVSPK